MIDLNALQLWIEQNPALAFGGVILICVIAFLFARNVIARGLVYLSKRTETKSDDILLWHIHPFRLAWLAPLIVIYIFAYVLPDYQVYIEKGSLVLILWILALGLNDLLDAFNQIYESSPNYTGVSIQGYLDIIKILVLIVGLILTFSLITDQSPTLLLGGLTALTAVLILVFRDTLLSVVASVQIVVHDLVKEGDWIEVPSYDADGDVMNISLHTIKVQNFDKTISVIPTYKMMEVAYKNWRGMQESGGRRIKRSMSIDLISIKFCDREMLARLGKIDLVHEFVEAQMNTYDTYAQTEGVVIDSPLDGPQITNIAIFCAYVEEYLCTHPSIHHEGMTLLVRQLEPAQSGIPVEIYVFTKTVAWVEYEMIQAEIIDHMIAAAHYFDLRVFQQPTGRDFAALAQEVAE